jgi:drug/metabolite transporter (DMT)-like permease
VTLAIFLALMSAVCYGTADFAAGLASRRVDARVITGAAQILGLLAAGVAVLLYSGAGPRGPALAWGAASGVGSTLGTFALYQGLSVARMSVVATLSGVVTAVIPVIVGLALGNQLTTGAGIGIVIAIPAIGLVSWQPDGSGRREARVGLAYGLLAGVGFAILFVALDQAGTRSGAWPLVPGQLVSVVLIAPFARRGLRGVGRPSRTAALLTLGAGVLSGAANLLFLAATGYGQLAIVAVLGALYPAVTVVLARAFLAERWTASQAAGLGIAAAAIALVTIG